MNKIGIISIGSGGTMGHMSLTTKLSYELLKNNTEVVLFTEHDYSDYSNFKETKLRMVKIPSQPHMKSLGGKISYKYKAELIDLLRTYDINILIFSTFYDLAIVKYARSTNLKSILISYPLRDSHREIIKTRNYYDYFDLILTLKDIYHIERISNNERIVRPIDIPIGKYKKINNISKILVTCGGGGRPSSNTFFEIVQELIIELSKFFKIQFTLIKGNSEFVFKELPNTELIKWSDSFLDLVQSHDLIISEAGYYTLIELISLSKLAIIIPGERRIDNQEYRAIKYESESLGFAFFPEEDIVELIEKVTDIIKNPKGKNDPQFNFSKVIKDINSYPSIMDVLKSEVNYKL